MCFRIAAALLAVVISTILCLDAQSGTPKHLAVLYSADIRGEVTPCG